MKTNNADSRDQNATTMLPACVFYFWQQFFQQYATLDPHLLIQGSVFTDFLVQCNIKLFAERKNIFMIPKSFGKYSVECYGWAIST